MPRMRCRRTKNRCIGQSGSVPASERFLRHVSGIVTGLMTFLSGFCIYFIVWWLVLFTTLPFGVRQQENVQPGNDTDAPAQQMMVRKLIATTLIYAVLFGLIYWATESGMIDFYSS